MENSTTLNMHINYINFQIVKMFIIVCLSKETIQCEAVLSVILKDTNDGKLQQGENILEITGTTSGERKNLNNTLEKKM